MFQIQASKNKYRTSDPVTSANKLQRKNRDEKGVH